MLKNKSNFFFFSKNFSANKVLPFYIFSKNKPKYLAKKLIPKLPQLVGRRKVLKILHP